MSRSRTPRLALLTLSLLLTGVAVGSVMISSSRPALAAEKLSPLKLIELARTGPQTVAFRESLVDALGEQRIREGKAYIGAGDEFLWAIDAATEPKLFVDDEARPALTRIQGTNLWVSIGQLRPGYSHSYYYHVDGQRRGGEPSIVAYLPESFEQEGVPKGTLSEKFTHKSKIYDGMVSEYWVYVPAQYDAKLAAPLMIWNDGGGHTGRNGQSRTQVVMDNLIHQKKIPAMISIFINPGDISGSPGTPTHTYVTEFSKKSGRQFRDAMRSTEYDTVSDRYVRFLDEEILAEVGQKWNLRKDGYSRAIAGDSSGAIAAFNAAWQRPEVISRVLSRIGTFTSIQWIPGTLDGGNIFPFAIRKTPRKNLRVWLSDGSEDLENDHGSWPLQNIQMANSLKMAGYDYRFRFGTAPHNGAQGAAEAPEALVWLWRDYDPAKTSQSFVQDPAEKSKPYYRVKIFNREH